MGAPPSDAREFEILLSHGKNDGQFARRKTSLAALLRWLVMGTFAAGVAGIVLAAAWQPKKTRDETVIVVPERPDQERSDPSSRTPKLGEPARPANEPSSGSAVAPKLADRLAQIENSIVKIESGGPAGRGNLGSGFVIDASGLVVTNYHVIDEATEGQVRFKSGVAYEIAGYAAVQPEHDLAILRIKDPPPNLVPLVLAADPDPRPLAPVVSIGHPRGVEFSPFDGKVSRVVLSRELPLASQQFLSRHLAADIDLRWIQHTASISEGNSGGPLLDGQGRVIGVNTWVDRESSYEYALHARYIARLLGRQLAETAPLERYASKEALWAASVARLSVERLLALYDDCQSMRWRPGNFAEYERLQQLAWALTYPRFSGNLGAVEHLDAALLDSLAKAADQVEAKLKKQSTELVGHFTLINEFAADQVGRPLAGIFFFGTVDRIVDGEDGSRGMLMKLAGFEQMLFLPLDGNLFTANPGTHCLVLGVNANGRTVRYGENPLRLITAPVILSRTILPLAE